MAEGQNVEWKAKWRDEYLKWVCGFANAQGGKIYIGADDHGKVVGVKDCKRLLEDIPNKIVSTLGIIADVNLLTKRGRDYIEIVVPTSPYPVSYHGEYHYRSGSTKQLLTGAALSQFLLEKTGLTWDGIPVDGVGVDDLSADAFDIYREQAIKTKRIAPGENLGPRALQLENLNLLVNKRLARAAILLFHHNPERWVPGAYVKIGRFANDANIEYQDEVHGSLFSQIDKVMDLLYVKYFHGAISYDGITRVTTYPYPRAAIREMVLNAIAHKNYALMIPIQIKVYPDHLVIANDCVFPKGWTLDVLLGPHRSRPYNPLIANAFYRAGFIESWGRGIQKIKESCEENGSEFPEFAIREGDIAVSIKAVTRAAAPAPADTQSEAPQHPLSGENTRSEASQHPLSGENTHSEASKHPLSGVNTRSEASQRQNKRGAARAP
ncbi:MAG: putative DNA binding domain-containing protein, partial [Planctomycetes bacterium]|nr:putative DNA binding domain-containing protein [Planctomycetota bacterium]